MQRPRIVLLTMVKNEEKILKRLFNSVAPWIDGYVLCDTGSTDGTVALAKELMVGLGKPGKVYEYPWENFGASRTKSFQCFQSWVAEVGWPADLTYGLLLDGDMILPEEGDLHAKLACLGADCGGAQLSQRNGTLIYKNTRLVRASKMWKCIGATHEYWSCENGNTASFEDPIINDIGDGGAKADKYVRDARLLEAELEKEPNNVRTLFYLGQTYMSLGRNEDAIRVLTRRIELGSWEEERYIAHLYKGDCLRNLKRDAEAVYEWELAFQLRQHRTEAPLRLVQFYRQRDGHQFLGYLYLEKLLQIQLGETPEGHKVCAPANNKDILFVSHRDMVYPVWEELGILAHYVGRPTGARRLLDRRCVDQALNFHERNRMLDLYQWYAWRLPAKPRIALKVSADAMPWLAEGFWRHFNPSIRREGDGYAVNLRTANYETVNARHYTYRGLEGRVTTRNIVARMGANFETLDSPKPVEIIIPDEYVVNRSTNIYGIEDCRWAGTDSFIGTSRQYNTSELNKMVRVQFNASGKVLGMKTLVAPVLTEEGDCQKNWLPFVWKGEEHIVYKIAPFQVFTFNGYKKVVDWQPPAASGITFDNLRGSAAPVPWSDPAHPDEALLMVVHFCHYGDGRRYYHRFMTLGADLKPRRLSRMFTLCDERIQYISGLCESVTPGHYVITYGVNDSQAWATEVAIETLRESLVYKL